MMFDNRIPQEEWKNHDFKKLLGLIVIGLAAVVAFLTQGNAVASPDVLAAKAPVAEAKSKASTGLAKFTLDTHQDGDTIRAGINTFGGEALPGTLVILHIDQYVCGMTTAGDNGRWEIERLVHESKKARRFHARDRHGGVETPRIQIDVDP